MSVLLSLCIPNSAFFRSVRTSACIYLLSFSTDKTWISVSPQPQYTQSSCTQGMKSHSLIAVFHRWNGFYGIYRHKSAWNVCLFSVSPFTCAPHAATRRRKRREEFSKKKQDMRRSMSLKERYEVSGQRKNTAEYYSYDAEKQGQEHEWRIQRNENVEENQAVVAPLRETPYAKPLHQLMLNHYINLHECLVEVKNVVCVKGMREN